MCLPSLASYEPMHKDHKLSTSSVFLFHRCNVVLSIVATQFVPSSFQRSLPLLPLICNTHNNTTMSFSEYVRNSIATNGGARRGSTFKGDQTSRQ